MDRSYCVFGDSVVQASHVNDSWPDLLKRYLEKKYESDWVDYFNLGVGGNTTDDLLKRLENETEVRLPTTIIIAIGVNDSGYFKESNKQIVTKENFEENLQNIINISSKFTKDINFIGLVLGDDSILKPFPDSSQGKSYSKEKVVEYDNIINSLVTKNECKYIYLYDKLKFEDFMDGLNPNDSGHRKMFDEIKKYF